MDEERTAEARAALAFTDRAVASPELVEAVREPHRHLHAMVVDQLRRSASPDPVYEADLLLCIADGLRTRMLLGLTDGRHALALLDAHLDRILPGPTTPSDHGGARR